MPNWISVAAGLRTTNDFYNQFRTHERQEKEDERKDREEQRTIESHKAGLKRGKQQYRHAESGEKRAGVTHQRQGQTHERSIKAADQAFGIKANDEQRTSELHPGKVSQQKATLSNTYAGIRSTNARTRRTEQATAHAEEDRPFQQRQLAAQTSKIESDAVVASGRAKQAEIEDEIRELTRADVVDRQRLEAEGDVDAAILMGAENRAKRARLLSDYQLNFYDTFRTNEAAALELVRNGAFGNPDAAGFEVDGDVVNVVDANGKVLTMRGGAIGVSPKLMSFNTKTLDAMHQSRETAQSQALKGDSEGKVYLRELGPVSAAKATDAINDYVKAYNESATNADAMTFKGARKLLVMTPEEVQKMKDGNTQAKKAERDAQTQERKDEIEGRKIQARNVKISAKFQQDPYRNYAQEDIKPRLLYGVVDYEWMPGARGPKGKNGPPYPRWFGVMEDGSYVDTAPFE